ncbi:dTMP kinase [Deinococcus radiophilus]|uniref:Thymidylate kinase n=1 Tax=Deinococcus radiophilus TaxID=32062 RepID=A0A3S0KG22_9DEIO|nr:dTMP kinase [Deinococcus radiophilus]RTR25920.1 dTMP kinase [Deinococcus radiophilus]UFA49712.1 dTMP kinase [Deinococcus radiophilus]
MAEGGDYHLPFITFEGPEGAGKSTQLARLVARLAALDVPHTVTKEPGGTSAGDRIRAAVLDPELHIEPLAEFLLYSASRAQLVREVLRPALARGEAVICDRYADSTLAYQGYGRGLPMDFLQTVTAEATGGLTPNLTVLLDLDPALGLERVVVRGQKDRLEQADLGFHGRLRQGFLTLAAGQPERWLVLDATRPADELEETIWGRVEGLLAQ